MQEAIYSSLADLLTPDSRPERLCTGFGFTEGPIWDPRGQRLLFSDMPQDVRRSWQDREGVRTLRSPSNKCNGMTLDAAGRLYVCEHSTSRLVRENADGTVELLADKWNGKALNSPNDVTLRRDGTIYFSDPSYGRMPVFGVERPCELDFRGLYRISSDGELHLERADWGQVNGLCLSPDETRLYVNDSQRAHIRCFDVLPDGSLGEERLYAQHIGDGRFEGGIVDGMKCDERGNIWVTGPGGLWVLDPGGACIGTVELPEHAGNLTWGGPDWRDLFVCCSTSVYRLRTRVRGRHEAYMVDRLD